MIIDESGDSVGRWEVVGYENGVEYSPFPIPTHGLPARFWRDESIN